MSPTLHIGTRHIEIRGCLVQGTDGRLFVESSRTVRQLKDFFGIPRGRDRIFFTARGDEKGRAFVLGKHAKPAYRNAIQGHIAQPDVAVMDRSLSRQLKRVR